VKLLGELFDWSLNVLSWFSGALLALMMLSISYEVVVRYSLSRPTGWINDVSGFILFVVTFIASAWILREDGHVSLEIIISHFSPKIKQVIEFITSLICTFICGLFAWKGLEAACDSYRRGYEIIGGITIPKHAILWFIPFGMSLLCVQFFRRAWRAHLASKKTTLSGAE